MIGRLARNSLGLCYFSAAKIIAGKVMADMPQIEFPTKPKPAEQEQFPMYGVYETLSIISSSQTISERIDSPTVSTSRCNTKTEYSISTTPITLYYPLN